MSTRIPSYPISTCYGHVTKFSNQRGSRVAKFEFTVLLCCMLYQISLDTGTRFLASVLSMSSSRTKRKRPRDETPDEDRPLCSWKSLPKEVLQLKCNKLLALSPPWQAVFTHSFMRNQLCKTTLVSRRKPWWDL